MTEMTKIPASPCLPLMREVDCRRQDGRRDTASFRFLLDFSRHARFEYLSLSHGLRRASSLVRGSLFISTKLTLRM